MKSKGRSHNSDVAEYHECEKILIKHLKQIHGIGSYNFWSLAVYHYVLDVVKVGSFGHCSNFTPYDYVAFKELHRGRRVNRLRRNAINNIWEIAVRESKRRSRIKKGIEVLWRFSYLCLWYGLYHVISDRKKRQKREAVNKIRKKSKGNQREERLLRNLPKCLVEDLEYYANVTIFNDEPQDTRHIKNGYGIAYAKRSERGKATKLYQHGAFYGELVDHIGTEIESNLCNQFYTWGWKYSSHHIPGFTHRLERFYRQYQQCRKYSKTILIAMPSIIEPEDESALAELVVSIRKSSMLERHCFVVRGRPAADEPARERLRQKLNVITAGDLPIQSEGSVSEVVASAKLVICISHPATLFLECVYSDVPVMAVARPIDNYHEKYREYVEALLYIGVLHKSIVSLAESIPQSTEDIKLWWRAVQESHGFIEYRSRYCAGGAKNV